MRIISGRRRGLKLTPPIGDNTRPTTDRVKESLFNILQMRFPCGEVLDLFAGSGALGLEALSRGALHVDFVERDKAAYEIVKKNIAAAKFSDEATLYLADALEFLDRQKQKKYDIIFLDPPYNKGLLTAAVCKIRDYDMLLSGGVIVAETECMGEDVSSIGLEVIKSARYGKTQITIFKR